MGLLDSDLKEVFGSVFGAFYEDGELVKVALQDNGLGDFDRTETLLDVKLQKDRTFRSQSADAALQISYTFLVLQAGLRGAPYTNDEINYNGDRFCVSAVTADPANTHWVVEAIKLG